jgi:2-methylcitrate dehydratase PrpD
MVAALGDGTGAGNGSATIIGTQTQTTPSAAAFANAVLGHGLVRDDMHLGSVSHLSVVVLPPALALAEQRHSSGRELLSSIVSGYEAGGLLGRAILDVDIARIRRPTGITGAFAGAASAGRIAGLDTEQLATALTLAANCAAGYNEWAASGGSEMYFHPGFAARNALTAVALAAAGACVSPTGLDGPAAMLAAFGKTAAGLTLPFAATAEILNVFFKEVPACNYAQTAAQAAHSIAAARPLTATAIEHVTVRVPQAAAAYPGCNVKGPFAHVLQAKMSIQYNVAAALLCGDFNESNFVPQQQPGVVDLAGRIAVEVDPTLTENYPARQGAEVVVLLRGGDTLAQSQDDVLPATESLVRARAGKAAAAVLGADQAQSLIALVDRLETVPDAAGLLALCRPNSASSPR